MADDHVFRVRPGRIRSTKAQSARPFIAQALAAARKAGGIGQPGGSTGRGHSRFGSGKRASIQANRLITARSRGTVIKARVVRHAARGAQLCAHLSYLRRDGVTRDGDKAWLFGSEADTTDGKAFAERCQSDRHHFQFIVSPDDALDMADLEGFTKDLVGQMQADLGTPLDWVAVTHWNTGHPHVHLIVRGVRDDGRDLVIARDYIKDGMRDRARAIITQELGPRTDLDIRRALENQIDAERWTPLDRQLASDARASGLIDLAPDLGQSPDPYALEKLGRLRKLETLGLADQVGPGQWVVDEMAETTLRQLGERGDIIKRMHRALTETGIERGTATYVLSAESLGTPVIGRLVARGLDDELAGSAFAVVDGVDGRTHHLKLPSLDAAGDGAPGSIVELRTFDDAAGTRRAALAVRSDLDVLAQITAPGATWLDRQAIAREPAAFSEAGFGAEARRALDLRAEHLVRAGLAERIGHRVIFAPGLIETLRRRDLQATADRIRAETGLTHKPADQGDHVSGTCRQRLILSSGRFTMIDDGLGFQLVPWTPSLDKRIGRHVSGVARGDGGIDWTFTRDRGLGL